MGPGSADQKDTMDLPQKLMDYLNEHRAPVPPIADPDEPLHIDSLGLIRLVAFMEENLGITIEDDELLVDNFATPRALSALLEKKQGAKT